MKKAYIFDMDGTLLDSSGIWERIGTDYLANEGIAIPPDYLGAVADMSFTESAVYTVNRFRLEVSTSELLQKWLVMAEDAYRNQVSLKPYAKEYLLSLKERGVKLAVASSLFRKLCEIALEKNRIGHLFDAVCLTDEVGRGKSSPDIYYYTAAKLGVKPRDCVVFEDILSAVKSAGLAGMYVCGVYDQGAEKDWELIGKTADRVIRSFSEAGDI